MSEPLISYAIPFAKEINEQMAKQSVLLTYLGHMPRRKLTEQEIWAQGFESGMQRVVQAIHDLTLEWGAYCYSDD